MDTPKDPTQIDDIVARIRRVQKSFGPKGLPSSENSDNTDPDFPTQRNLPKDIMWNSKNMITGSGSGPEISTI